MLKAPSIYATRCAAILLALLAFPAPHSELRTPHSALRVPPSALRTPQVHADVQLCQYFLPDGAPPCDDGQRALMGVDCEPSGCGEADWRDRRLVPWQAFGQGEYVGPPRASHVPEYRLRVDDVIDCVYRATREELSHAYELEVGDEIRIESINNPDLNRTIQVQPDGNITVLGLTPLRAARRTIAELQADLTQRYRELYVRPSLTLTPVRVNTRLLDLLDSVNNRFFSGGLGRQVRVMPDGTIHLPAVGSVPAQGLTLDELQLEIQERYRTVVSGLEVTPILFQRAPRFVYVAGEVRSPGRYTLEQPTTSMMAISLAGGSSLGGNLREIVVFRRTDDWRLMATRVDLNGALLGKRPCPADEIWLRDSDIVLVPKSPLLRADNLIELVFTRGIYGVVPAQTFFAQKNVFIE